MAFALPYIVLERVLQNSHDT